MHALESADRGVTRRTRSGVHLLSAHGRVGQLHSLAERIHDAADEVPLTDSVHAGVNILDDLADSSRGIAGLITHLTAATAVAARTERGRAPEADITPRTVTQLAHTVGALGHALADLGEAVVHAGVLHQLAASGRSTRRNQDVEARQALLRARIDSARSRLHKSGALLHQAANRLAAPPTPSHSPRANATSPITTPSATPSRTR
ncbi:hypothetical protein ACN6LM_002622 [Streptomyces sp. SAS_281]|uniref:hypothetical protein n=1 Tax=Streptomyces sp. SAS_281 TaxID=3412744 RepID=UPI00403D383D